MNKEDREAMWSVLAMFAIVLAFLLAIVLLAQAYPYVMARVIGIGILVLFGGIAIMAKG